MMGLDEISACFCSSTFNQPPPPPPPGVPYKYINKLPISSLNFVHYAYDNEYRGANGTQGKILSYSELQGIWALVENKRCSQK